MGLNKNPCRLTVLAICLAAFLPSVCMAANSLEEALVAYADPLAVTQFEKMCHGGTSDKRLDNDRFLLGKAALASSYLRSDDKRRALKCFRILDERLMSARVDSWGSLYYLKAIRRMMSAGSLHEMLSFKRYLALRSELLWQDFVDPKTFELINKPTNYYGVAYGIAAGRCALGWDSCEEADIFMERLLNHIERYSDGLGVSDESEGHGLFDRYSLLLIAEIAQHAVQSGREVPEQLKGWLRNISEYVLHNLNTEGHGFQFGRSVGPYGDSAFVEILAAAARLGLLSGEEKALAYTFTHRAFRRLVNYWYDDELGLVNLWFKGRRTDDYRGEHRSFGETLSLLIHYYNAADSWRNVPGNYDLLSDDEMRTALASLPRVQRMVLSRGEHVREVLTVRDGGRVFNVWLSNGGRRHERNMYFPIPFSAELIEGVPEESWPQLLPVIELSDGSNLAPLVYYSKSSLEEGDDGVHYTVVQEAMDVLGPKEPKPDTRASVTTRYSFSPGRVARQDTFRFASGNISGIRMQFGTFAAAIRQAEDGRFIFEDDRLEMFSVSGLECEAEPVHRNSAYLGNAAPMRIVVSCGHRFPEDHAGESYEVRWELRYSPLH